MSPVLELRGVSKRYRSARGPVEVLRDVNLELGAGEFGAITGPSGSGKTTLLNLAALLDRPSEGTIFVDGESVAAGRHARRLRAEKLGMVFQQYCLLPHRSTLDNVLFRCRYLDTPRAGLRERGMALLEELGLADLAAQPARLLSGGEKQRVAIARAMLHPPRLIAADEPTGNLDRAAGETVMELLRQLNERGVAVLLATHNERWLGYASRHFRCIDGGIEVAA